MCFSLETLTAHIRTGSPILVELIDLVNSVVIFPSQMTSLRWLTFLLGSLSDSHSPALLDFFLSSNASICSTMTFLQFGNSEHVVSVSTDFPRNSKQDALFHRIAYNYSGADWVGLRDYMRDVPWEDIFKLSASAAAGEFCEWVQVGIDVYIPHCEYQVKLHSSPWFSAACAAAIVHRNHFFCLYQQNTSSESKVKFRHTSNLWKRVFEAVKLAYAIKTNEFITSEKLGSWDF